MKKLPACRRPLCAALFVSLSLLALPATAPASEEGANLTAEAAGERASFARTFCEAPPEHIDG